LILVLYLSVLISSKIERTDTVDSGFVFRKDLKRDEKYYRYVHSYKSSI